MAKRRVQVQDVNFNVSPQQQTIIADSYVRAAPTQQGMSDLEGFVAAIAPVVDQKIAEEKQQKEDMALAIRQGVVEQQAYQVEAATRQLTDLGNEDFKNNYNGYLGKNKEDVAAHRQTNYENYYKQLEEQGTNPVVIRMLRQNMEAVDYKFFTEVYNPLKTKKNQDDNLAILGERLKGTMTLEEGKIAIDDFFELHPEIDKGVVSDYVLDQEADLANDLDANGDKVGKSWRSDWLVENKRTTVPANMATWDTVEDAQKARDTSIQNRAVTTRDAKVSSAITNFVTPTIDMIEGTWKGREDYFLAKPEEWATFMETQKQEVRKTLQELFPDDEAAVKEGMVEFRKKSTEHYNKTILPASGKFNTTKVLNQGMTNVLRLGVYAEDGRAKTPELLDQMIAQTGLPEDEVIEEAVKQQLALTEVMGIETGLMDWLKSKGVFSRAEYTDDLATITEKNAKFLKEQAKIGRQERANVFAEEAVANAVRTQKFGVLGGTVFKDADGTEVTISSEQMVSIYTDKMDKQLQSDLVAIETEMDNKIEVAQGSDATTPDLLASLQQEKEARISQTIQSNYDQRMKEFYLPSQTVPEKEAQILANPAVLSHLTGRAGEPLNETTTAVLQEAITTFDRLNDYQSGFAKNAYDNPEVGLRMRLLSDLMRMGGLTLQEAVNKVDGKLYEGAKVTISDEEFKEVAIEVDWWPDSKPFKDVQNSYPMQKLFESYVNAFAMTEGLTKAQAIKRATKEFTDDTVVIKSTNDLDFGHLMFNTGQKLFGTNASAIQAAQAEIYRINGMEEFVEDLVGENGGIVFIPHPTNANMTRLIAVNETGEMRRQIKDFAYDDLNSMSIETLKANIVSESRERLSLASSLTAEEFQDLSIVYQVAGVPFTKEEQAKQGKRIQEQEAQAIVDAEADRVAAEELAKQLPASAQQVMPTIASEVLAPLVTNVEQFMNDGQFTNKFNTIVTKNKRKLSDKKAISKAISTLKEVSPELVTELELDKKGLFSRLKTERGITVNEQGEIAHAVLALIEMAQE